MSASEIDAELEAWVQQYQTRRLVSPGAMAVLKSQMQGMTLSQRRRFLAWLESRGALQTARRTAAAEAPARPRPSVRGFGLPLLLFTGPVEVRSPEAVAAAA